MVVIIAPISHLLRYGQFAPVIPHRTLPHSLRRDTRHVRIVIEIDDKGAKSVFGQLSPGDVVITHHLPSARSTPEMHRDSALQPWFVASDTETLFGMKPSAWIHGHTHARCDYVLHETRVLCNQVGYPDEIEKLPPPPLALYF
jgi:hypothetical protein